MWEKSECKKIGSLVLGTGTQTTTSEKEGEKPKSKKSKAWNIDVDKRPRFIEDRVEAQRLINNVEHIEYETMFMKGHGELALIEEQIETGKALETKLKKKAVKEHKEFAVNTEGNPERTDEQILKDMDL
jgi:hypothetical protein